MRRARVFSVALVALSACDAPSDVCPAPPTPRLGETHIDPAPPSATPAPSNSISDAGAPLPVVEPTGPVTLTWVVHPTRGMPGVDMAVRRIDVMLTVGKERHIISTDVRGSVFFDMSMQPLCYGGPHRKGGPVSELFMNGGGNQWLSVDRTDNGALEVTVNQSSDGNCDEGDKHVSCPVSTSSIGTFNAGISGAEITEVFKEVGREELADGGLGKVKEFTVTCR
jgi:hypothetical protein